MTGIDLNFFHSLFNFKRKRPESSYLFSSVLKKWDCFCEIADLIPMAMNPFLALMNINPQSSS